MTDIPVYPAASATRLRTNSRIAPLGIDTSAPTFSWNWSTEADSYRVQVAETEDFSETVWDSRPVLNARPFGVHYEGKPLRSRRRYWWRVSDTHGEAWSEPAWFETAFLAPDVPTAEWIGAPVAVLNDTETLYLNHRFVTGSPIARARLYASALGWYRFFINGRDVTEGAQVPRWTPLGEVVEYQVYDVTADLRTGLNALAIAVGDGRYRGNLGGERRRARFGDRLAGFAYLEIEHEDGSIEVVRTGTDWAAGRGRIRTSDPQSGEVVDLRMPDEPWLRGDITDLAQAVRVPTSDRRLIAEEVDRVEPVMTLPGTPKRSAAGKQLIDFGQNISGFARLRLTGPRGAVIRITYSELLRPEGELDDSYLWNLQAKNWWQRDEVTLDGQDTWYEPWFAVRGFRYVEIDGLHSALAPGDVEAVVVSTALSPAGTFTCSEPRLNKLHENVVWSMRGNFVDTPTDCPTRERAGWTGDAQVFAPTAAHLMDVSAYFQRYLRNLRIDQLEDGTVPPFVPNQDPKSARRRKGIAARLEAQLPKSTGWGDAAVLIPWALYRAYGDITVLRDTLDSMRSWVSYLEREAAGKRGRGRWLAARLGHHDRYIIGSGHHFGEWLRPDDGVKQLLQLVFAPASVVATAYFAHSTRLLAQAEKLTGDDHRQHEALAGRVTAAWRAAFVRQDGARIGEDKQDDYVRALAFDLLPEHQRPAAIDRLVELIRAADCHLGTGFLGTPMILGVLTAAGRADVAYRLLLQESAPSWLHQITHGATTVWETWDGYARNGRGKNSHNHYAFGTVANWLIETVAGIAPAAPGYRRIRFAPIPGAGIEHAAADVQTPFGLAAISWRHQADTMTVHVQVPVGATGELHIGDKAVTVTGGSHDYTVTNGRITHD